MNSTDPKALLARSKRVIERAEVERALDRLAQDLEGAFRDRTPIFLTVMNGGMIPGSWLVTRLTLPVRMDYVHATRYRGATSGSDLAFLVQPHLPLEDETVIIFDDIYDEGYTLEAIKDYCIRHGAAEVATAVLVRKVHDRGLPRDQVDFFGMDVPDVYVFGCGMDVHEYWRQLTDIWALDPDTDSGH